MHAWRGHAFGPPESLKWEELPDPEVHDGQVRIEVKGGAETARFDYRGYGTEWSSIIHHHNQQTTPRNKGGALGARCMRFK